MVFIDRLSFYKGVAKAGLTIYIYPISFFLAGVNLVSYTAARRSRRVRHGRPSMWRRSERKTKRPFNERSTSCPSSNTHPSWPSSKLINHQDRLLWSSSGESIALSTCLYQPIFINLSLYINLSYVLITVTIAKTFETSTQGQFQYHVILILCNP